MLHQTGPYDCIPSCHHMIQRTAQSVHRGMRIKLMLLKAHFPIDIFQISHIFHFGTAHHYCLNI